MNSQKSSFNVDEPFCSRKEIISKSEEYPGGCVFLQYSYGTLEVFIENIFSNAVFPTSF